INFYPNSANIYEPQHDELGNAQANTLYDPSVTATLEKVARLSGQYERAVIAISGHTDSSMKGRVPRSEVDKLSYDRAAAVKTALIKKYQFDPNKFVVEGKAWDVPADPADPQNQALNRRVEISIYPPESK
ncbi:MAG TPA: OmpA family protein, partial [Candidatus Aminicenantes bacterium]|nr:OmpA family protein [Candidatus Aminicenantes bacterium]